MKIKVNLNLFRRPLYLGLFLLILRSSASYSTIFQFSNWIDTLTSIAVLALLIMEIVIKHYSWKRLLIYAVVGILSLIGVKNTGNYVLFWTVLTCIAICDEDIDAVAAFMYKCQTAFFAVHSILAICLSVITGYSLTLKVDGTIRYCFGFVHPNTFSIYFFGIIVLWVWLNFEKITGKQIGYIALVSFISYVLTRTRTILVVQIVFVLLLTRYKTKIQSTRPLAWCSAISVPIISGLIFFLVDGYYGGNRLSFFMDRLLNSRIRLGSYAYEACGLTLLGENFNGFKLVWDETWRLSGMHTFDCVYTYFFSNQGLVWLAMIIIAFVCLVKHNNAKINIMLIVWSLYGISEVHVLDGARFFPILLVSLLIGSEKNQSNGKYKNVRMINKGV